MAEAKVGTQPLRWLLGQLWECTDLLPSPYCDDADLLRGATYAKAVRKVADDLGQEAYMAEQETDRQTTTGLP